MSGFSDVADGSSWLAYTATIASSGGTFTGATIAKVTRYKQIGKTVFWSADITLSNLGSGSPIGNLVISLPLTPFLSTGASAREVAVLGAGGGAYLSNDGNCYLALYNGNTPIVVNYRWYLSGAFEIA